VYITAPRAPSEVMRKILREPGMRLKDKSFLFIFFKKESAFFFEKKKQKTFDSKSLPL
jgi:hypothetical protein